MRALSHSGSTTGWSTMRQLMPLSGLSTYVTFHQLRFWTKYPTLLRLWRYLLLHRYSRQRISWRIQRHMETTTTTWSFVSGATPQPSKGPKLDFQTKSAIYLQCQNIRGKRSLSEPVWQEEIRVSWQDLFYLVLFSSRFRGGCLTRDIWLLSFF